MTISRGQMERQLYEGGGIMSLSKEGIGGGNIKGVDMGSRIGFFNPFKAAKKAVKKVTKGVKGILSSDAGKAALLAAATFKLGGGQFGKIGTGNTGFKFSNILPAIIGSGDSASSMGATPGILGKLGLTEGYGSLAVPFLSKKGGLDVAGEGKGLGTLGKLATLSAVSAFLTKTAGMTEEQAEEEVTRDPSKYLELYYRNLNPPTADTNSEQYEKQVRDFVTANTSEYAEGGRIMRAEGDSASDNAMQAAGIEGLPIRQNPKGVKELDLRDSGGFIPPVGIKEKEDDIPAMLSNNEFVFTADAVRGMGDGDVDVGAQRMYDMMKQLEAGGRV